MLVIDDFNELIGFEAFFRRLGFDVLSLGKDLLVADAILGFVPDLVIATARGRAVDGMKLAAKLRRNPSPPRVALVFPSGQSIVLAPETQAVVDALIEIPSEPKSILRIVGQLVGLDPDGLIEKFERLGFTKANTNETMRIFGEAKAGEPGESVTGGAPTTQETTLDWDPTRTPGQAASARSARSDRYDRFLAEHDEDTSHVLPRQQVASAMKKLKEDSEPEKTELERIDEDKRNFARALFEEGKKPKS